VDTDAPQRYLRSIGCADASQSHGEWLPDPVRFFGGIGFIEAAAKARIRQLGLLCAVKRVSLYAEGKRMRDSDRTGLQRSAKHTSRYPVCISMSSFTVRKTRRFPMHLCGALSVYLCETVRSISGSPAAAAAHLQVAQFRSGTANSAVPHSRQTKWGIPYDGCQGFQSGNGWPSRVNLLW